MKVHLIKEKTITKYCRENARAYPSFRDWLEKIDAADWESPQHIVRYFGHKRVDILGRGSRRVVFDIGGNEYRIICQYFFGKSMVHLYIQWIGTHAEYSKVCNSNLQYEISNY